MTTISQAELDAIRDLRALQQEIEDPKLDSENPHFKSSYTSLREVLRIARPLCNKHNFVLIQRTSVMDLGYHPPCMALTTELVHVGGHVFPCNYLLTPQKNDPQGMGAAVTYARRFSIKSMLCMADQDDDGNEASGLPPTPEKKPKPTAGDFQEARKKTLLAWMAEREDDVLNFLHGPTWGKEGAKLPWLEPTQGIADLKPDQLHAIVKSDASLEKFKSAVLSFNDLIP